MIETLKGMKETVNFKEETGLRLYINDKNELYPNHWHTPLEVIMPTCNSYKAFCGNKAFDLKEGDVLFIAPGVIHNLPATPVGERLIFQADISFFHNIKELELTLSLISPALVITEEFSPTVHKQIRDIMISIQKEYHGNTTLSEAAIYSKLIKMFVLIGREYATKSVLHLNQIKQKKYTDKFLSICKYIDENCTMDITLDTVADLAGFSKYHFTRLFKQFTGITFYTYLNHKKIALAENLLIDPDISVTEVALRSGFTSLSSFIRMFKHVKSCTPTEFRNMYNS